LLINEFDYQHFEGQGVKVTHGTAMRYLASSVFVPTNTQNRGCKKRGIIKQRTPERGVLCWWRGKRKEKVRTKTSRKKPQQKMRKNI
jgi:hypothetical protein